MYKVVVILVHMTGWMIECRSSMNLIPSLALKPKATNRQSDKSTSLLLTQLISTFYSIQYLN